MPISIVLMMCILMNHSMHNEAPVLCFQSIEANNQSGQQGAAFGPNAVTQMTVFRIGLSYLPLLETGLWSLVFNSCVIMVK